METIQQPAVKKGRLLKWKPKKWRPEYERMVVYSVLGKSNLEIAKELGYTPQHVSNVLNLDMAEELRVKIMARMRENALTNIPDVLDYVAQKTAARMKEMVDNDELFQKSPFAVIDRGIDVLKGLNHLKGGGNGSGGINVEKAIILPAPQANNLFEGLNKANEVRRIHSDKIARLGDGTP